MYRQTDDRKVWYEWMAEVFAVDRPTPSSANTVSSPVMTGARAISPDAQRESYPRRFKVGVSDLHSSIKEGCLM